jgi:glycosyltransferase involved in cell wall biosynthesis
MSHLSALSPSAGATNLIRDPLSTSSPAAPTVTSLLHDPPSAPSQEIGGSGFAHDHLCIAPPPAPLVSLAHDYLLVMRGAERTFAAIADLYSQAPIFTLLYDEHGTNRRFADRSITTSPLQRLGIGQARFRRLLPLYPLAVERLRPPASDVVLSSSSAFAHGLPAPEGAVHICYCYTPFRYAWDEQDCALDEVAPVLRPLLRGQLRRIRRWDLSASRRVDAYIAISKLGRERIRRCYGRDAAVIHPPVETHRFAPGEPGDSLLVVSELVRHKRVHVALEAARRARAAIRVVGSGPDHAALARSYPEAEFLGRASDEQLVELYASARAVVVPSIEEFGITAVEAQAAGRPVIAAAAGGALETVLDGQTGRLAKPDDIESFAQAIREIDTLECDPAQARCNAERFSVAAFQRRLAAHVAEALRNGGESSRSRSDVARARAVAGGPTRPKAGASRAHASRHHETGETRSRAAV